MGLFPPRGPPGAPRKNLALLGGRPLLVWTLDAAQASTRLARIVVSTDDEEIAAAAREAGVEVLARPPELSAHETPMRDVVLHALDELGGVETVVLLQPTSPLRRAEHVDEAIALLEETGADCVVSVVEVPHVYRPSSLMELREGRLEPLDPAVYATRDEKPLVYARNGPAVLAARAEGLRERTQLHGGDCRPYVMDARDSIDIDGPFDLELAELLLAGRPA